MTGLQEMYSAYKAVTYNAARALNLEGYGLKVGSYADMVVLQCHDPIEALRLRPQRLLVIRRGKVIAKTAPSEPVVSLGDGDEMVSFFL